MCFTGNYGCNLDINASPSLYEFMFSEELGLVIEVAPENVAYIMNVLEPLVPVYVLGNVIDRNKVTVRYNQEIVIDTTIRKYHNLRVLIYRYLE